MTPDFFIPSGTYDHKFGLGAGIGKKKKVAHEAGVIEEEIKQIFVSAKRLLNGDIVKKTGFVYEFILKGTMGALSLRV